MFFKKCKISLKYEPTLSSWSISPHITPPPSPLPPHPTHPTFSPLPTRVFRYFTRTIFFLYIHMRPDPALRTCTTSSHYTGTDKFSGFVLSTDSYIYVSFYTRTRTSLYSICACARISSLCDTRNILSDGIRNVPTGTAEDIYIYILLDPILETDCTLVRRVYTDIRTTSRCRTEGARNVDGSRRGFGPMRCQELVSALVRELKIENESK